ncbi:hypothetical protein ASG83_01765 [Yonghaparkia sp. Soil809]|nr:hypothetical protein ASC54_05945 [Yonghaparkia sp. Root332]KRF32793.1 hypothetical protein ASG83_01765 [Yonghaparkia sp. Soil809]
MRSSTATRLVLATGAAMQAAAHAAAAGPLVASGHVIGSILALFCLVGVWAALRLLLVDCVEGRAIVVTLAVLTLIGIGLSTTIGYPGQEAAPLTAAGIVGALSSVTACAAMLVPRTARAPGVTERATYHR